MVFDSIDNRKRYDINYVPGDLTISDKAWHKINLDSSSRFFLKFNYSTFKKADQSIVGFHVELTKEQLMQKYLILNIYDFRDKKYKRWYQDYTDDDFLAELYFPNHGILIRKR